MHPFRITEEKKVCNAHPTDSSLRVSVVPERLKDCHIGTEGLHKGRVIGKDGIDGDAVGFLEPGHGNPSFCFETKQDS